MGRIDFSKSAEKLRLRLLAQKEKQEKIYLQQQEKIRQKRYQEKRVARYLKECVQEAGGLIFKQHPMTNAGIPDYIVHIHKRTFYIETKTTGGKCTELQVEFHRKLKEKGIETFVLDTRIRNFYELYEVAYKTYNDKYNSRMRAIINESLKKRANEKQIANREE